MSELLIAYFDESGSKDTPFVTMAGYLSTKHKWKRFEREWPKTLKEYGAKYLHMREYAQCRGEFAGWEEWRRKALLQKLIWVIKSNVLFRVATAVRCAEHNEIFGADDLKDSRRSPFWLCFNSCISATLVYCERNRIQDNISLVFDKNSESSTHAQGFYSAIKEHREAKNRHQLVSLSFEDDKVAIPLQAADLLAYEFNKYHRGFRRKSLEALDGTDGAFGVWDREGLEQLAAQLRAERIAAHEERAKE